MQLSGVHVLPVPHPRGFRVRRGLLDISRVASFEIGSALAQGGVPAYEPEVFALTASLLEAHAGAAYLDIGANVGAFSLLVRALFGGSVDVWAFEPHPGLFKAANEVARINRLRISIHELALAAEDGEGELYLSAKSDASNSLSQRFRKYKGTHTVPLRTLDTFASANGIDGPCVIKIDTESTEPDVLAGGKEFIRKNRPWIICEVLPERTETPISSFLEEHDYVGFHITDAPKWSEPTKQVFGDTSYKYRDWLLAPRAPSQQARQRFQAWFAAASNRRWSPPGERLTLSQSMRLRALRYLPVA